MPKVLVHTNRAGTSKIIHFYADWSTVVDAHSCQITFLTNCSIVNRNRVATIPCLGLKSCAGTACAATIGQ